MDMTGTIPAEISLLTKLTALSLDENNLTGSIPSSIQTLVLLGSLTLGYNKLDSSLPTWIGWILAETPCFEPLKQ
jgi:Leucine-rich repeat (LRR) protein